MYHYLNRKGAVVFYILSVREYKKKKELHCAGTVHTQTLFNVK